MQINRIALLKIGLIVFCFFFNFKLYSQENDSIKIEKDNFAETLTNITNTAFQPGERLKYRVRYGIINGGEAEMTVGMQTVGYDVYYHAIATASTTGITKSIALIQDIYESYFDITSGLPIKSIRNIHENDYRKYTETLFRRNDNVVLDLLSGTHSVPPSTFDILSAFYYARRYIFQNKIEKDEIIVLTTFFDDEIYNIKIRYKETEDYKTDFGKIHCLRFAPFIEPGGTFKTEDDMKILVSDDGNYIPVFIKMKLPVGSLKCELSGFENLSNPFGKYFLRNSKK